MEAANNGLIENFVRNQGMALKVTYAWALNGKIS